MRNYNQPSPCAEWTEKLTKPRDDFSSAEYRAFEEHLASCSLCRLARIDFQMLGGLLRSLPGLDVSQPHNLPARMVQFWEEENAAKESNTQEQEPSDFLCYETELLLSKDFLELAPLEQMATSSFQEFAKAEVLQAKQQDGPFTMLENRRAPDTSSAHNDQSSIHETIPQPNALPVPSQTSQKEEWFALDAVIVRGMLWLQSTLSRLGRLTLNNPKRQKRKVEPSRTPQPKAETTPIVTDDEWQKFREVLLEAIREAVQHLSLAHEPHPRCTQACDINRKSNVGSSLEEETAQYIFQKIVQMRGIQTAADVNCNIVFHYEPGDKENATIQTRDSTLNCSSSDDIDDFTQRTRVRRRQPK